MNFSLRRKKINIFYLDQDPVKCAEYHVDKHCVKMILEYCQLISTAHRVLDGTQSVQKSKTGRNVKRWILNDDRESVLYSATHNNHPSAVWVRQSKENYGYLVDLLRKCLDEYTYRYGKKHKCEGIYLHLIDAPMNIAIAPFTEPTPAMPDSCKVPGDSIASYRNYYRTNKEHLWSWKGKIAGRDVPYWLNQVI